MNYALLFGLDVQLGFLVMAFVLVMAVIGFILDKDTTPQVVVATGVALISIAACAVVSIDAFNGLAQSLHEQGKISGDLFDQVKHRSNLFLFVFPFVTAAIGTNLISDVLTKKLHYEKTLGPVDLLQGCWELLKILFGVVILPFVAIGLVPFLLVDTWKRHVTRYMEVVGAVNRHLQLKMLKADIISRNLFRGPPAKPEP
ncbi:hypothetical protein SAMN05216475_1259 [Pseudomonas synxantha]|uniref:Uncharacterized protein n=1 Tax=Pseudomonas synxantha TaxID=47883 RepID=A0AAX3I560_9PSED|nr:hypothetical protein [Pseudomonas synxantha]AZE68065.1 hypothetical protein C4K01_3877 [Pseudomonas synxantha]KRP49651.1 hypothetical protein TU77_25100 [Pseudomonas synxantha]SDU13857.1 hypothetical protein SAMN05216475_1259 [Pseudomonas synxantha]VTQ96360.1 Uncharacterised protein [Pseudomonas synxantha]